ncbi:prepilin peptidase [Shinella sp. G-2]|uniref:preprotein translocase subunit SecA n=1 Tax=Shinella sp. G-2 TaxID=3133141 RepID=UPI003D03071B
MRATRLQLEGITPPQTRFYPERKDKDPGWLDEAGQAAVGRVARLAARFISPFEDSFELQRILSLSRGLAMLDEAAFDAKIREARVTLRLAGLTRTSIRLGIALAREASFRTLGLRQHKVQIRGALAMLRGRLIEMDTGEGKTITAGLAAAVAAMAGLPTHVITVNNYLAERDAQTLRPVYARLGLSTGVILEKTAPDERRAAYRCDITYGSNTEIAFDYLRDRLAFGQEGAQQIRRKLRRVCGPGGGENVPVMRGLHFAIVDEADSVLVDEARTPLIISRQSNPEDEAAWTTRALQIARALKRGPDYKVIGDERRVELTETGRETIGRLVANEAGLWESPIRRGEVIHQALTALLIFKQGEHYLVNDGKVQIVDEYSGRLQPDRSWSDGMHQLIETKENVEVTGQNLSIARMTYQRLFRRYLKLAGMTGTAREVTGELISVYGLVTQRIPPNRPSRLRFSMPRVYRTQDRKWRAVVADAKAEINRGRAVLVGTRSVAASYAVSAALTAAGVAHRLLNAETDAEGAAIIAQAGQAGQVTVATNMAGRGVDIALAPEVVAAGGLHVICTERHDAGRIDRQLAGRAGRRGEPGSVSIRLSLEDPLLEVIEAPMTRILTWLPFVGPAMALRLFDRAQRQAEKSHARMRKELVRQDRRLNQLLSFTGGLE